MTVIPPCPAAIEQTEIFLRLTNASRGSHADLLGGFLAFKSHAQPLLALVLASPFRHFTLHDALHPVKLAHLASHIVDDRTLDLLSQLELRVLLDAFYLHDLGMAITSAERERSLQADEYIEEVDNWPELNEKIVDARTAYIDAEEPEKSRLEAHLFELQEAALCQIFRRKHASRERYRELVAEAKRSTGRADLFKINGTSYESELIDICVSHNEDSTSLLDRTPNAAERFPADLKLVGQSLNMQFCAAVLRLADILDFDRERTPKVLFESLSISDREIPGANVSLEEWNKHLAVHTLDVSDQEITISADSEHPAIEQSIRSFATAIEREIRDTCSIVRRNPRTIEDNYRLKLPFTVVARIRSIGYVYKDLAFRLNEAAITDLLMGKRLYSNRVAFVRELVQNAVDACEVRGLVDPAARQNLSVNVTLVSANSDLWIEVTDNGIGMDEYVLSNFFFRKGASYYSSPSFRAQIGVDKAKAFSPISRFGIGVLSTFVVGEQLEVLTKNGHSPRRDFIGRQIRIEGKWGLAWMSEDANVPQGTKMKVKIKKGIAADAEELAGSVVNLMKTWLVRPKVPVTVSAGGRTFMAQPGNFFTISEATASRLTKRGIRAIEIDLSRWSNSISGRAIVFAHISPEGGLSFWSQTPTGETARLTTGECIKLSESGGNRITVNGFLYAKKKLSRVLTGLVPSILDIDVELKPDVVLDVGRTKVSFESDSHFKSDVRKALLLAIKEMGHLQLFDQRSQSVLNALPEQSSSASPIHDEGILARVEAALPKGNWAPHIHKEIASQLGLSNGSVSRAISTLIDEGRVVRPKGQGVQ